MRRKWVWLALPLFLVLCATLWGAKWRSDHPTPTKYDLELRALMLQSSKIEIIHFASGRENPKLYPAFLSKKEFEPFVESFFSMGPRETLKSHGDINVVCSLSKARADGVMGAFVNLDASKSQGHAMMGRLEYNLGHKLHPFTAKRWSEFLLNHPRIGPEIRKRLNQQ